MPNTTTGTPSPAFPAATDRIAAYLETVPASARGIVERALLGQSRATAVKAKCLTCTNFDRAEIADCPVTICPLHPYRPFQDKSEDATDAEMPGKVDFLAVARVPGEERDALGGMPTPDHQNAVAADFEGGAE